MVMGCVCLAEAAELVLTWTDNSDNEEAFKIERALGANEFFEIDHVAANVTTYTDAGLPHATLFRYRVRATNAYGDSDYSNIASAMTKPDPADTTPWISAIADQAMVVGTTGYAVAFTVLDADTDPAELILTRASSNPTLLPESGIVFEGSDAARTVVLSPVQGQSGTAVVTITVSDGEASASVSFNVVVGIAPLPPSGFTISDQ